MRNWIAFILVLLVSSFSAASQSRSRQQASTVNKDLAVKTREAPTVLVQAKRAALKIESDYERGLVLDQIGEAEAQTGALDAAVATANQAYPHTYATLVAIGEQLGDSNEVIKARIIRKWSRAVGLRLF
jgi:hypothetical protein